MGTVLLMVLKKEGGGGGFHIMITVLSGNITKSCFRFLDFRGLFSREYELCESIFKLLLVAVLPFSFCLCR